MGSRFPGVVIEKILEKLELNLREIRFNFEVKFEGKKFDCFLIVRKISLWRSVGKWQTIVCHMVQT